MNHRNPEKIVLGAKQTSDLEKEQREIEKLLPLMRERLTDKSKEMRSAFPFIDEDFRINPEYFTAVYPEGIVSKDTQTARRLESEFQNKKSEQIIGELLEEAKTLTADILFKQSFLVFRTAKFDDYVNGIDELIFDKETRESIAVIDMTTNLQTKLNDERSRGKIVGQITGGGYLKYGLEMNTSGKFEPKELKKLPVLYLEVEKNELLKLTNAALKGDETQIRQIGDKLQVNFIKQCEAFSRMVGKSLSTKYITLNDVFRDNQKRV